MPVVPGLPSPRSRRWSRIETIAWIAYRRFDLVQRAAALAQEQPWRKRKKRQIKAADPMHGPVTQKQLWLSRNKRRTKAADPLHWLVVSAMLVYPTRYRMRGGKREVDIYSAGKRVAAAERMLSCAERKGLLTTDKQRKFSRLLVQQLFPAREGRGRGQQALPSDDREKIIELGFYFMRTPPERRGPLNQVRDACELPDRFSRRIELRKNALKWAFRELALREELGCGIVCVAEASQEEFDEARRNLESWQLLICEPDTSAVHTSDNY